MEKNLRASHKSDKENKVDLVLDKWSNLQKILKEEITMNEISK